jgi:hypothetical protein
LQRTAHEQHTGEGLPMLCLARPSSSGVKQETADVAMDIFWVVCGWLVAVLFGVGVLVLLALVLSSKGTDDFS